MMLSSKSRLYDVRRVLWVGAAAIALMGPGSLVAAPSDAPPPAVTLAAALETFDLRESARPVHEALPGWTAPRKLVVVVDRPERTAWLQEAMPAGVKVVGLRNDAVAGREMADADAMVVSSCQPANFVGAARLKWIHAGGAGSDQCLAIQGVATGNVLLTNSQKVKNTGLAEMAIGYVFALSRSLDVTLANQHAQAFDAVRGRPARQIAGSTMLVVGLGGAGTEIARLAHGLGMKVIATRNSSREGPDFVDYVGLADELPALIGQADVVMISTPLTPVTRGLFDAAMLARMKKTATLINWTRAEIVVAKDLDAALREGRIGGAALNWATYAPLAKGDPLWTAPNLILAPWGGARGLPMQTGGDGIFQQRASTPDNEMRWLVIRENMRRFATGGRMFSVFDLERGY
jgi:phosphoglycerate dehydrogenase-like enzyme